MRFYNGRFAAIARQRRTRHALGRSNSQRTFLFQSFSISPKDLPRIMAAAAQWMLLELREGWRSWFGGNSGGKNLLTAAGDASAVRIATKAESV